MKNHPFFLLMALLLFFLSGCEKEPTNFVPVNDDAIEFRNRGNGQNDLCFNFRTVFLGELDYFAIEGDYELLPQTEGWGGVPQDVTLGEISGKMGSFVTNTISDGSENSAVHYELVHFFLSDDGESYFYTNDRAVCAPIQGTANPCHVNDQMTIVAGDGIFEGVTGKIATHGEILITGVNEFEIPIGVVTLDMHGRICIP